MGKQIVLVLVAIILALFLLSSCSDDKQEKQDKILSNEEEKQFDNVKLDIKVAVVYGESGSYYKGRNHSASKGIKQAQEVFGFELTEKHCNKDEKLISETLTEVSGSHDMVICVGRDIANVVYYDIGYKFPDTEFVTLERKGKYYKEKNTISVMPLENETTYIAGVIAAEYSKEGKVIAMISPTDVSIERSKDGFSRGAKRVNPQIFIMSMVGSPSEGENSVKSNLISHFDMGFDVLFMKSNRWRTPVLELAKEYGIKVITENGDFYNEAPETIIASISKGYDALMFEVMRLKAKNKLTTDETIYVGVRKGFNYIIEKEDGETLNPKLMKEIDSIKMDLAQGKINFDYTEEIHSPME